MTATEAPDTEHTTDPLTARVVRSSAFHIHPDLEGQPLALPARRIAAFAIDVALLLVPSLLVALVAALGALAVREPAGFDAAWRTIRNTTDDPAEERLLRGQVAALLVRIDAQGVPPALALAVEDGNLTRASEILEDYDINFQLGPGGGSPLRAKQIRVDLDELIPGVLRGAALFGVAGLYFTLLTAGGRRTIGKRFMGTSARALDGRPLTLWDSFERFGGYFATAGTFGLGLLDLWREPNRRLAHDRLANTVVVDTRPALPDHARIAIPPLLIYVVIYRAAVVFDRWMPLPAVPVALARPASALLVLAWAILFFWSFRRIADDRYAGRDRRSPRRVLVTEGPYRLTRNPIYLSMLFLYAAIALWFAHVWPLVLLPLVVWTVQKFVVKGEESYLERRFGDEYRRYQKAVRRWV